MTETIERLIEAETFHDFASNIEEIKKYPLKQKKTEIWAKLEELDTPYFAMVDNNISPEENTPDYEVNKNYKIMQLAL